MPTLTAPQQQPAKRDELLDSVRAEDRAIAPQEKLHRFPPMQDPRHSGDGHSSLSRSLLWLVVGLSAYALLGSIVTLIGWFTHAPRLTDWIDSGIQMFANTAIAGVCASLAILARLSRRSWASLASRALAFVVAALGAITLFEHITGINVGVDTLLVNPVWDNKAATAPGRMGPPASTSFTLLGLALLLISSRSRSRRAVPALAILVICIGTLSIVGYLFQADPLFSFAKFTGIALQTASIIFALALAVLVSAADLNPIKMFREKSAAGVLVRRALPFTIFLPLLLGWLFILGRRAQWFDRGMGTALLVLVLMALLCGLLCWCAASVAQYERVSYVNEHRLQSLLSVLPAAVYTCDAQGHITFYNRRAVELWGREPSLNGSSPRFCACYKVFLPDGTFVPPHETPMACATREGKSFRNVEAVVERPDGSKFVAGVNIDPLYDSAGNVCGAINVFQDITPLKRAEDELRVRKEQLQAIIENSPECVKLVSADGTLLTMNSAGLGMVEADSSREVIGKSVYEVIALEFRDAFRAMNERVCAGAREHLEFEIIGLKGTRRWMETNAASIIDPVTGQRVQLAVTRDITERRQAEAALRQSELLFRQLADTMPQIVWAARPDGYVDYYNKRWYEFTGFPEGGSGDESWKPILHPDDVERSVATYSACIRDSRPYPMECRFKDRSTGGYRWFLARALPIRDDAGKIIRWFGTCTDIDDQKRAEEKLEQAVAERTASLKQAVAQMEEFSYSVSHDLRAPLRAIQGFARILDQDYRSLLPADAQALFDKIARNSVRMDQLINDVLALTRIAQADIRLHRVRLRPLIEEIIDQHTQMQPPNARVEIGKLTSVLAYNVSIKQAIANLLSNAVKFVTPGVGPHVKVWTEERGDTVRLWIQDNGIGIKPEQQEKLFGMFQRLQPNEDYDGTGIGLVIVRKAVQRMGGEAGVESDGMNGSRFWIDLKGCIENGTGERDIAGRGQ